VIEPAARLSPQSRYHNRIRAPATPTPASRASCAFNLAPWLTPRPIARPLACTDTTQSIPPSRLNGHEATCPISCPWQLGVPRGQQRRVEPWMARFSHVVTPPSVSNDSAQRTFCEVINKTHSPPPRAFELLCDLLQMRAAFVISLPEYVVTSLYCHPCVCQSLQTCINLSYIHSIYSRSCSLPCHRLLGNNQHAIGQLGNHDRNHRHTIGQSAITINTIDGAQSGNRLRQSLFSIK
jgi:hypothetical protein